MRWLRVKSARFEQAGRWRIVLPRLRWRRLPGLRSFPFAILILLLILAADGCQSQASRHQTLPTVRVAIIGAGSGLIEALTETFPRYFPSRVEIIRTIGVSNARLVEEAQAEMAIIPVNVAYSSYWERASSGEPKSKLRGVAVLGTIPLFLVASANSKITSLREIRHKRIAIGTPGSTTHVSAEMVLEGIRMSLDDIEEHGLNRDHTIEAFRAAKVDAVFQRDVGEPSTVEMLLKVPGSYLVNVTREEIDSIRSRHPFLHGFALPADKYGNDQAIRTLGIDGLLVCRSDLSEELVYSVARAVTKAAANAASMNSLQLIDLRRSRAVPIPLHPGAARYFREQELFE